jgi:hypothetical protein
MFLVSIRNPDARKWAVALFLSWCVVFGALFFKLPLIVSAILSGGAVYLNIRYSNWLCANEEKLAFINAFAREHTFPSSLQIDRAQLNMHLTGFLGFFCVPLLIAALEGLDSSQPKHFFYVLLGFTLGVFAVTGVIHTFVRRSLL